MPLAFQTNSFYAGATISEMTTGFGVETSSSHCFFMTVAPTDNTLATVSSGTYDPGFGGGPIGPIEATTLLDTQSVSGFTVQIWERAGTDDNGSDSVYYQWSVSPSLAGTLINRETVYGFLMAACFQGGESYRWAATTFTGGPPQTFPDILGLSAADRNDVAACAWVDQPHGDGTGATAPGEPDLASPLLDNGTSGFFTGLDAQETGTVGYHFNVDLPVSGYQVDQPGASWQFGALALFLDILSFPVESTWNIGFVGPSRGA